jgi:hypothetical protein
MFRVKLDVVAMFSYVWSLFAFPGCIRLNIALKLTFLRSQVLV